jgi:hypothetical protein
MIRSMGSTRAVGDVIDDQEPGLVGKPGEDFLDDLLLGSHRDRQVDLAIPGAGPAGDVTHGLADRVVHVGRCQQFVPRRQSQRPQDGIDPLGRVGHQAEVFRPHPQPSAEAAFDGVEQLRPAAGDQLDRFGFDPAPPIRLFLQHRSWAGPEGAVVEERHSFVQEPFGLEARTKRHRGLGSVHQINLTGPMTTAKRLGT